MLKNWRIWIGAAIVLVSQLLAMPRTFWENDEFLFAEAVRNFDPSNYHPHPPGYPLYVLIGKALDGFFRNPFVSLVVFSVVAAVIGFVALARAFRFYLDDDDLAVTGALVFFLSCAMLVQSPLPMSDGPAVMFVCLAFYAIARMQAGDIGRFDAVLVGVFSSAAIGVRPQLALPMMPAFAVALWQMERMRAPMRQRLNALTAFVATSLLWFVPLMIAAGGLDALIAYETKQAAYVATHDAGMSRGAMSAAAIGTRFILHPWGSKLVAIPIFLCALVGLYAIVRCRSVSLHPETSRVGLAPLVTFTAIHLVFALTTMDPADAVRYAMPSMILVALAVACGFGVIRSFIRSPRVPWFAAALLAALSFWYAWPVIAERTSKPSPVASAAAFARAHFAPNTVILYELGLRPHAEYLMSEFRMMPVEQGIRRFYDHPEVPLVVFGDGGSHQSDANVFAWSASDAYGKLTRNHARIVSLDPLPIDQRFLPLHGVYALERTIDGDEWRWLAPDATMQLPHVHGNSVTLALRLSSDSPYDSDAVDFFVNGKPAAHVVATRSKVASTTIALPRDPNVEVTIHSAQSFLPAGVLHNQDPRTLAVQLVEFQEH